MIAPLAEEARSNPFPGLRPFEPDEDHLFFGRERQIDELLRRLRTTRFLAILGTSGCGKSSLVRSGLIPSLHGGAMTQAGSSWRIAILRPGEDPIGNLAVALDAPEALGREDGRDGLSCHLLATTLRASNQGLIECVRQARTPPRSNLLVLVDQFEELFRFKQSGQAARRDEAVAFVKLLLEASRHREVPIYIALTLRSDFIGNCLELPGLPEAINEGLYLVPRMTRDELRSAITGPVAVGGAAIAPRLVSRLLNDVGDDPDQLPILQHALMRTWDRWEEDHAPGEPLDLRHYEAVGTMQEALSRHAEEALGELDERGRSLAEALFKALTEKEADGRGIRRTAPVAEIAALTGASETEIAAVVEIFRRPGRSFLMPPARVRLQARSVLDISHESLMRIWDRLRRWVDEEARSAQVYRGLARAAADHEAGAAALWRDPELQIALQWKEEQQPTPVWASRYDPTFERAMSFLAASAADRDREVAEKEERRRRALRRAWLLTGIFAAAALTLLALAFYAVSQRNSAEKALTKIERQNHEIEKKNQQLLAETRRADEQREMALHQKAVAEQARGEAELQTLLTLEQQEIAEAQRRRAEAEGLKAQANAAAANAARLDAEGKGREAEQARQQAVELQEKAVKSEEEATRLSRLSLARALALQVLKPAPREQRGLNALLALEAYRLNRQNAGLKEDPDLFNALWTALLRLHGEEELVRGRLDDAVRAVAVDPLKPGLITGSDDGTIRRFDDRDPGTPAQVLGPFESGVRSLVLGPNRLLAAAFADGTVRVWEEGGRAGLPPRAFAGSGPSMGALAVAHGLLAAGSTDGSLRVWNLENPGSPPVQLRKPQGSRVSSLAFSRDGKILAAGTKGGAEIWQAEDLSAPPRSACRLQDIRSVAFSPDGQTLACGTSGGEVVLWSLSRTAATSLEGHASSVNSLSFNAEGSFLASASSDATLRLWDLRRPDAQPIVLTGHTSWIWSATYTPDGDRLISGSADRTVRLWPAHTDFLAGEICRKMPLVFSRSLTREQWSHYIPDLPYKAESPCPAP